MASSYKYDIHDKISEFINDNNFQLLSYNHNDINNKKKIKLIKKSIEIVPVDDQKKTLLKIILIKLYFAFFKHFSNIEFKFSIRRTCHL